MLIRVVAFHLGCELGDQSIVSQATIPNKQLLARFPLSTLQSLAKALCCRSHYCEAFIY